MKTLPFLLCGLFCMYAISSCSPQKEESMENDNLDRGKITLDALYQHYSVPNTNLLRENYPFDTAYSASYLASEQDSRPNPYSYLWPYSGTFSAVNALFEATEDKKFETILEKTVLPGLEEYFDQKRFPEAYASYINSAPESDRFYDDNVWLGIDFCDLYTLTGTTGYLEKATLIWEFIRSGTDDVLGGGIYWCEQKKESKNTCSNAPGSVLALKLFIATGDSIYFREGKGLYQWTKQQLQDTTDYLYFDNIKLDGRIGKTKYPYNSGQMLQATALLYQLTKEEDYLKDAQHIAQSGYEYFFTDFETPEGEKFRLLKNSDVWFIAVMLRGFIELYEIDNNKIYLDAFQKSLNYAWTHTRDENGLFNVDWTGKVKDDKKWLLTQAAMVEMYGRMATVNK